MFIIVSPPSSNHHLNVSAAGLLHPDPAGVDYLGVDRKKNLTVNKNFPRRCCRNKTSQTSSILLEATGKLHWQTSNRKMMPDSLFSADPCAAHQSSLFSMEDGFHRKVTHRVLQDMLENCIIIFTTALCNMFVLSIFSSNTSARVEYRNSQNTVLLSLLYSIFTLLYAHSLQ